MKSDDEDVKRALKKSGLRNWIGVFGGFRFAQDSRYKGTLRGRVYWCYEMFTDLAVVINAISLFAVLLCSEFRMIDRCLACFPGVSCLLCLFMSNYPKFKRGAFISLVEDYENAFPGNQYGRHLDEEIEKGATHVRGVSMCLLWLEFFPMMTCCMILPLLNEATGFALGPRKLPLTSLWPWDPLASFWKFMIVVFAQFCGSVFVNLKKIGFEESFFIYGSRQICLFKHLRLHLERIFDPLVVKNDGTVYMNELIAENRYLMDRKLSKWVQDHQNSLRMFKNLETLYEWPLLAYFGATILILCSATYVTSDNTTDAQICIACGIFAFGIFIELLFICRMGDHIKHETEKLLLALPGKNVFLLNSEEYKYLRMIMTRCQSESMIKSSGGFPLTISTFIAITRSSYSYYTLLKEVNGKTD